MPDQSSAATEHAILQEITAPLETLPDDPLSVVNADFPAALRGYDRLAVDAYVQQTAQLVAELQATRSPEAAVRRALERVGEQISGILQRAHETAEEITAQSRREAEDRLEKSRIEAAEIIAEANRRVTDLDADTDRIWVERHRIVDDARELAHQLIALAETAAERFPPAETTPYDDDAGATRAPITDEEEATIAVSEGAAEFGNEDEDQDEDEFEPVAEQPPSPGRADEVEKTMAFSPLDAEPEAEAELARGEEAAGDDRDPADAPPQSPKPRRSNSVIPPASQAANRRSSR
jgi:cell division septum initiation protein DivIVA